MKVLFWSAPPYAPTGYGVQCLNFCKRLQKLGHEVHVVSAVIDHAQPRILFDGISILPGGWYEWGQDGVVNWSKSLQPDLVLSMVDLFPVDASLGDKITGKWCPFVTIDSYPLSERIALPLRKTFKPIAYSHFGKQMLEEAGFEPYYIPLGIDTKVYRPLEKKKSILGLSEDTYLVGMVAMNLGLRKAFDENFQAFAQFHERHPKSVLYVHTLFRAQDNNSQDLQALALALGLKDCIIFPDPWQLKFGFTPEQMAHLYNAFDVLLAASHGEAFGVPIVEAQACGVPVISSNHSAMKETGALGVRVNGAPRWTLLNDWEITPNINEIEGALEYSYKHKPDRAKLVEFASQYDFDLIVDKHLVPFLNGLM